MLKINSPFPCAELEPTCKLELFDDVANFFKAMMIPVGSSKGALKSTLELRMRGCLLCVVMSMVVYKPSLKSHLSS